MVEEAQERERERGGKYEKKERNRFFQDCEFTSGTGRAGYTTQKTELHDTENGIGRGREILKIGRDFKRENGENRRRGRRGEEEKKKDLSS